MITDLMTILREIGETIYAVLVLPGQFVLSWFAEIAPTTAAALSILPDDEPLAWLVSISLLSWILVAIVIAKIRLFLQNLRRSIAAITKALSFRLSLAFGILRKRLVRGARRRIPHQTEGAVTVPGMELDDLDLAVLRSAAACGPGIATSAPDLAEQLWHRPSQIQSSLKKLSKNMLLEDVIGSTDGYDNYRLSESGSHYVANLHRKIGNL